MRLYIFYLQILICRIRKTNSYRLMIIPVHDKFDIVVVNISQMINIKYFYFKKNIVFIVDK